MCDLVRNNLVAPMMHRSLTAQQERYETFWALPIERRHQTVQELEATFEEFLQTVAPDKPGRRQSEMEQKVHQIIASFGGVKARSRSMLIFARFVSWYEVLSVPESFDVRDAQSNEERKSLYVLHLLQQAVTAKFDRET